MAWEIDPDFALQSRVTYGRTGPYLWTLACAAAVVSPLFSRSPETAQYLLWPGLFLLFVALPYSAIQVLALERDGRFDQHRLTGRPPLALGVAVLAGSSWPLWLTSAVLVVSCVAMGLRVRLLDIGVIMSLGVTLALALLALPSGRVGTWILRALIAMVAALVVVATQLQVDDWRPLAPYGGTIMVAAAATSACVFPWIMRRIYRPAGHVGMPSTIIRPLLDLNHTRVPELVRTLLGSGAGAAGALGLSITALAVLAMVSSSAFGRDVGIREPLALSLLYVPVMLAAYNSSTASTRERQTGGLDRMLLAEGPWTVALQFGAGAALPFLLISAAVAVSLIVLGWREVYYMIWPLPAVAALMVGAGLAEGFRARPLGLYSGAVLLCLSGRDPLQNAIVYSGFWIAWIGTVAALRRSGDAAVRGAAAVIASAYVGVIAIELAWHMTHPFLIVAGFAALPVGLFVPDGKAGGGAWHRAACVLSAGVAAGVMAYAVLGMAGSYSGTSSWPHWPLGPVTPEVKLVFAVTGGLYAAAGLLCGWLLHNLFGVTPIRSRLLRSLPLIVGVAAAPNIFVVPGVESFAWAISRKIDWSRFFVADFLILVVLLLVVVALLAVEWRRARAGTLRTA